MLKRSVRLRGGRRVTVGVGEPLAAVAHAQAGVARAFILAGVLALAGALLASYLIGTRVSRPLRRMAAVAARVDAGDLHPRIHDPGGAGARGARADRRLQPHARPPDRGVRGAARVRRRRLARAAHAADGDPRAARGARRAARSRRARRSAASSTSCRPRSRASARLVDDLLLLAKSEQTQFLRVEPIELAPFVSDLWDGISLIAERRFELAPRPAGTLRADPDRLAQALRNLLATRSSTPRPSAGSCACGRAGSPGGRVRFLVEDDGPGIPRRPARARLRPLAPNRRGARPRLGRAGLGLAIVRAIAEAHGGPSPPSARRRAARGWFWSSRASLRRRARGRLAGGAPLGASA